MSVQAMTAVMDYSAQIWGEKFVLLLIANQANWPDAIAEMSEAQLANEAGRTPRYLRKCLRRLEECGELICHQAPGKKILFEIPPFPGEPDRREAMERAKDARKRTYDARLERLRHEREQRAAQRKAQDKPARTADLHNTPRDWDGLKKRVTQHDTQESAE